MDMRYPTLADTLQNLITLEKNRPEIHILNIKDKTAQEYNAPNDSSTTSVAVAISSSYSKANHTSENALKNNTTQNGIAVKSIIPIIVSDKTEHIMRYAIYRKHGTSEISRFPQNKEHFIQGDIHDIADTIRLVAVPNEDKKKIIQGVTSAIRAAAGTLDVQSKKTIIDKTGQKTWQNACMVTCMVWFSAILMQRHLAEHTDDVPPPNQTAECVMSYQDIWNKTGIFGFAADLLNVFVAESATSANDALQILSKAAADTKNITKSVINAGAALFPYMSENRSTAAEYYTKESIAEMLARLTIKDVKHDNNYFKDHTVADLACGTGALLRAGYRRIRFLQQKHHTVSDSTSLYNDAINHGLIGIDVSAVAVHLAAFSILAMGNNKPHHRPSNIAPVRVGGPQGYTGAIEYMQDETSLEHYTYQNGTKPNHVTIRNKSIDYILMNPPYSRSRNGQAAFDIHGTTARERALCQNRWKNLMSGHPAKKVAGMAPTFIILASKKIKNNGRIGFVLPITAAFAEAWAVTREFLQYNYTDITAITFRPGKSLSYDTSLNEMLLVATKLPKPQSVPSDIHCVTLNTSPTDAADAAQMAKAIQDALHNITKLSHPITCGDTIGVVYRYTVAAGRPWSPLGVQSPTVAQTADLLSQGIFRKDDHSTIPFSIRMTPIQDVFSIGPTHHTIGNTVGSTPRGAFELHKVDSNSLNAYSSGNHDTYSLWNVSKYQDALTVQPTHYTVHHDKADDTVQQYAEPYGVIRQNTTLFYNRRLGWTVNPVLGATAKYKIMGGNGWLGLWHKDTRILKAAALWFNSTWGLMVHWTQASRSEPGRATAQVKAIKQIPCPSFDELSDSALNGAAKFFDDISAAKILPACYAHTDDTRHAIDEFVLDMVGVQCTDDTARQIRQQFCAEPTIHNNSKSVLNMQNRTHT